MKRTLLLVALVGCASDKPDIDPSGTVQSTLTWGGGNCRKTGNEGFTISILDNGYGSYDVATNQAGASINGFVECGPEYCRITVNQYWSIDTTDSFSSYSVDATLTLDSHDKITGTGTYHMTSSAMGSCDQQMTVAGSLL